MLSLSLDTGLESFSPMVWALIIRKSAQTLTTRGFSSRSVYALLHGAVVATKSTQLALNPYQAFQSQSIRN